MPDLVVIVLAIASATLAGLAFLLYGVRGASTQVDTGQRLAIVTGKASRRRLTSLLNYQIEEFGRHLVSDDKDRSEIRQMLQAAGFLRPSAVNVFAVVRIASSVAAAVAVAFLMMMKGWLTGPGLTVPFVVLAFTYIAAKYVLRVLAQQRLSRVRNELPFVLDLVLLTIDSGPNLDQALRFIANEEGRAAPTVNQTLRMLVNDLDKGTPYEIALRRWGDRLGIEEARDVSLMFTQSLVHGSSLGDTLRDYISELSDKRVQQARNSIGVKTTHLTIVMVGCFMPALMILLGGPAVSSLMTNLKMAAGQ